jgi:putative cardiolipin synthase
MTFATDAPGANFGQRLRNDYSDKYRYLRKTIFDKVSVVDKSVLISSPYMIDSSETNEILDLC